MDQIPPSGKSLQLVGNDDKKSRQRKGRHPVHGEVTTRQGSKLKTIPESDDDSAYSSSSEPSSPTHQTRAISQSKKAHPRISLKESWERIVNYINVRLVRAQYPEPLIHAARDHMKRGIIFPWLRALNR